MPLDCSPEPSQLSFSTVQSYDQCKYFPRKFEKSENTLKFAAFNRKFAKSNNSKLTICRMGLDDKDKEILRALQQNARLTTKELAAKVHLSTTPVFERVRRLEREGFIKQYATILDAKKLNKGFTVFCSVKLRQLNTERANAFTQMIREIPEVTECYNISGSFDYMLRIQSPDMQYYQRFLLDVLGMHDNIASLESTFVMEEIKHEYSVGV